MNVGFDKGLVVEQEARGRDLARDDLFGIAIEVLVMGSPIGAQAAKGGDDSKPGCQDWAQ